MTVNELLEQLGPIAAAADEATLQPHPDIITITQASIVLSTLMGVLTEPIDREGLGTLAITAGLICEHRVGLHDGNAITPQSRTRRKPSKP